MLPSEDHKDAGAVDVRAHKRPLKNKFIKKPSRNEPAIKRSEFNLFKMPNLVKVLNKISKHLSIGKELRNIERNKKVLNKPLEHPVADRIKRSIGYNKAKKKLIRWNAVATGAWAKNLQVRAKYVIGVIKEWLSEPSISRELTQKQQQAANANNWKICEIYKISLNLQAVKGWTVEECEINNTHPINITKKEGSNTDTLDDAEDSVRSKVADRFKEFTVTMDEATGPLNRRGIKRGSGKLSGDLSFKQQAKRPAIDENISTANVAATADAVANINPEKFWKITPNHLPDTEGDFGESADEAGRTDAKRLTIADAFEDNDIVADFAQERDDERRKNEPEGINLTLPGSGSWAGSGISKHKPAKKLIPKLPKVEQRNKENMDHVIIDDAQNKKLREHQLTKPAITTKLGAIIEPITNEFQFKRPFAPASKMNKRVATVHAKAEHLKKKDDKL